MNLKWLYENDYLVGSGNIFLGLIVMWFNTNWQSMEDIIVRVGIGAGFVLLGINCLLAPAADTHTLAQKLRAIVGTASIILFGVGGVAWLLFLLFTVLRLF